MSNNLPPWYHGCMSANKATAICMKVGQNGAFLVRQSQGFQGAYTLSMLFDGEVYHHRIQPTGNKLTLESTKKEFPSLEKLVEHYMVANENFLYPLTVAIYPSLVKQMIESNPNWQTNSPSSPLYVDGQQLSKALEPITVPKPIVPLVTKPKIPVIKPPKPAVKFPTQPILPSRSTKDNEVSGPESLPSPSLPILSAPEEDAWPDPPPSAQTKPDPPPVKAKPLLRRTRSDPHKTKDSNIVPANSFTTFGVQSVTDVQVETSSGTGKAKPASCVFPSNGVQLVFDIPNRQETEDGGQTMTRRRTLSEINRRSPTSHDYVDVDEIDPKRSQNKSETGPEKKLIFKTFRHFLKRIKKARIKNNLAGQSKWKGEQEVNDDFDRNKNQEISEDYTPILCKTQFITSQDYSTSENALNFTKGTEMVVKGVRIDGWWYCYSMSTKEHGWVYMDYLKPKSDEKWFEAKPVETTRDYAIYDQLNFESDSSEFDDDEVVYCKYLIPGENNNGEDNISVSSDQSEGEVCKIGTF